MAEKVVTFELLGDLPGGEYSSIANDVSGDGSVVVGESRSEDGRQAFRWAYGYCTLLNKWMYVPYSATQAGMGWVYLPK